MWNNKSSNNNNNSTSETSRLLMMPSNASGNESSKQWYFLNRAASTAAEAEREVEGLPEGASQEEFAPRVLEPLQSPVQKARKVATPRLNGVGPADRSAEPGIWTKLFGSKSRNAVAMSDRKYGDIGTLVKTRKAPIKIEPKVFFANERTFLAWMHLSVILAGGSIAILAFSQTNNPFSQLYGVILLPVAIAFILYSMYQYKRRAIMIRTRHPGPYEDTTGPTLLAVMLMLSILAQFALKLYDMSD